MAKQTIEKTGWMPRPKAWGQVLLLSAAIVAVHAINLTADVPDGFAPDDIGLRVDEGYKTLAPRNLVLFGQTQWSEHDEYPGWFGGSPLTQSYIYLAFRVFEPSIAVARTAALLYFLALVVIVLWAIRDQLRPLHLFVVAALLAVEPFLFFFSRVALFEIALAAVLALFFASLRKLHPGRPWLPLTTALVSMVSAALLIKLSAVLYFLPAVGALSLLLVSRSRSTAALGIIAAGAILLLTLLAATYGIWSRRLDLYPDAALLTRLLGNGLAVWSPWIAAGGWFCVADTLRRQGWNALESRYFAAIAATVIGTPILLAAFSYAPPRYFAALLPAYVLAVAFWLGQRGRAHARPPTSPSSIVVCSVLFGVSFFWLMWAGADAILPWTPVPQGDMPGLSAPGAVRYLLPAAVAIAIGTQAIAHFRPALGARLCDVVVAAAVVLTVVHGAAHAGRVWFAPDFGSREVRQNLQRHVPEGRAVVGDWSAFFALGTGLPAIYSSTGQNEGDVLLALCPGFFLDSGTRHDAAVLTSYRALPDVQFREPQTLGAYAGATIRLHPLAYSDGRCAPSASSRTSAFNSNAAPAG